MNRNDLDLYFSESTEFNAQMSKDLEGLVAKYPYFQPAWMLLAKAKYKTQSADYYAVLGQAAARVFNREQLYHFIYAPSIEVEVESANSKTVIAKEDLPKEELKTVETQEVPVKTSVQEQPEPLKPIKGDKGDAIQAKENLRSIVKRRLEAIDEEKENHVEPPAQEVAPLVTTEEASKTKGRLKVDIIESFIKHSPGINKPKDDAYIEEMEFAKKGLEERFDFVSETLAEINLKQGHKEKALKIYKQLILKYPEKSSYFAAQIKKVESQSNK